MSGCDMRSSCFSTCDSLPRDQGSEAQVIITRRIRTLRMLVLASFPSIISCRAYLQLGLMACALDREVFMLPEGYRHDIQHKNQPLASNCARTRSWSWASFCPLNFRCEGRQVDQVLQHLIVCSISKSSRFANINKNFPVLFSVRWEVGQAYSSADLTGWCHLRGDEKGRAPRHLNCPSANSCTRLVDPDTAGSAEVSGKVTHCQHLEFTPRTTTQT